MTTTSKSLHRTLVSLKLPTKVPTFITYAQGIVMGMTGNPSFPSPTPPLSTVTQAIDDLQVAETAALSRVKGAVATRNEKRMALVQLLQPLKAYVQTAADMSPENAPSIIQSAGMAVKKMPVRTKRAFAAKPGTVSGTVTVLTNAAARRASYDWEYSTDGGKTWLTLPSTLQAKTTVSGLTPGATATFRFRALTKTGEGDWSQPTSLLVR
jgi:hypothetical protein